jgi:hypothetical protein
MPLPEIVIPGIEGSYHFRLCRLTLSWRIIYVFRDGTAGGESVVVGQHGGFLLARYRTIFPALMIIYAPMATVMRPNPVRRTTGSFFFTKKAPAQAHIKRRQ